MSSKDLLRSFTPNFLLNWNRKRKKNNRNKVLENQNKLGSSITVKDLANNLRKIGIEEGDVVLVHSALSKIGYLENGPATFVDALIEVVGSSGHILMPTSPNHVYQLNYIRNTPFFDVKNTPSKTGKITEYFRTHPKTLRSLHPTEPVSVFGPNKEKFIQDHFKALTPYDKKSPFNKVAIANGKILYVGVTLDMAGTSLHTLEDAVPGFKFPVYYPELFKIDIIDYAGEKHTVETKVHDPKYSKLRKCDSLIPLFEKEGVLKHVKIGEAKTLMVDAKGFFDAMIKHYHKNGTTMYTPNGEKL